MTQRPDAVNTGRSPWVAPHVESLPRLTDLTLATGGGIPGGGSGGSTVIP